MVIINFKATIIIFTTSPSPALCSQLLIKKNSILMIKPVPTSWSTLWLNYNSLITSSYSGMMDPRMTNCKTKTPMLKTTSHIQVRLTEFLEGNLLQLTIICLILMKICQKPTTQRWTKRIYPSLRSTRTTSKHNPIHGWIVPEMGGSSIKNATRITEGYTSG